MGQNLGVGACPPPLPYPLLFDYWETWLKLVMLENLQACSINSLVEKKYIDFFFINGGVKKRTEAFLLGEILNVIHFIGTKFDGMYWRLCCSILLKCFSYLWQSKDYLIFFSKIESYVKTFQKFLWFFSGFLCWQLEASTNMKKPEKNHEACL